MPWATTGRDRSTGARKVPAGLLAVRIAMPDLDAAMGMGNGGSI